MSHEYISRIQLPTDIARIGVGLINILDPDLQSPLAQALDRLPFPPDTAYRLALEYAYKSPYLNDFLALLKARERKIPTRAELDQRAEFQLMQQARHNLAYHYPYFPDVPQPHEELLKYPLNLIFGEINTHDARRVLASLPETYHPAFGFPEIWYKREGDGLFPPKVRRISPDLELFERFYPENERGHLFEKLESLATEVADSKIPPINQDTLDTLRFLGLGSEEEFIKVTENNLIDRISQKGGDTARLRQFMEFAKASDQLRTKKRRTGENYYCHYLASAWLLWTFAEKNLLSAEDIAEAVEDTEIMMVHDIMEDLEFALDFETGTLSLPDIDQKIQLTYDKRLILETITRRKTDDGAIWLDRINIIHDKRDDSPKRNATLKRRASRCKVADRFANLPTMAYSEDTYKDVLRNLEEAELSGGQLLVNSLLTGVGPITAVRRLRDLTKSDQLESTLVSIGLIAQMEKRLAQVRFGEAFLARLRSEPETAHIIRIIDDEILGGKKYPDALKLPYWHKRLEDLAACYDFDPKSVNPMIPAVELSYNYGVEAFASHQPYLSSPKPWEFDDLLPLIEASRQFNKKFIIARGVLPGGVDDVFLPKSMSGIKR